MEDLLSLAEAADELGVAPVTLRAAVERGRLAARKFGGTWVTTRAAVEAYRRESLGQRGRPANIFDQPRPNIFDSKPGANIFDQEPKGEPPNILGQRPKRDRP